MPLHSVFTSNDYLSTLCSQYDIVLVQEHWLRNLDLAHIGSLSSVHVAVSLPADHNDNLSVGRPYGGLSILAKNNLIIRADLGVSINNHVQAILLEFFSENLLSFMSTYHVYQMMLTTRLSYLLVLSLFVLRLLVII